jgi:hypothetical protein
VSGGVGGTEIGGRTLTSAEAGRLSSLFDVGGIVGGIAIGALADCLDAKALTTSIFLLASIPALCAPNLGLCLNPSLALDSQRHYYCNCLPSSWPHER